MNIRYYSIRRGGDESGKSHVNGFQDEYLYRIPSVLPIRYTHPNLSVQNGISGFETDQNDKKMISLNSPDSGE